MEKIRLTQTVKKGGCAAKVSAGALRSILEGVRFPPLDADVVVDGRHFDDAAIYRVGPNLGLVQTLDFFTPIVDTPYLFGQIAASNALSDVYAMGGVPKTCMAILAFPLAAFEEAVVQEVLQGACDTIAKSGASLVGGHSIDDESLKFGLSVTGFVRLDRVWANTGARIGDALILTKPLGTGTLCAGLKNGAYTEQQVDDAIQSMVLLNDIPSFLSQELLCSVHAATDVTGFGLAGHAMQFARASEVTLLISSGKLPLFSRTRESLSKENLTKAHRTNREYTSKGMRAAGIAPLDELILFDPQTSGGLLLAVESSAAENVLAALKKRFQSAALVGSVQQRESVELLIQ